MDELTPGDYAFILESLAYTKKKFSDYTGYPTYEFKRQRISECEEVIRKVRAMRDAKKEAESE